jgi:hypothetical protein
MQADLLSEIDEFLAETGMGESRFGLLAARNSRLMERLRQGVTPKGKPVLVRPETERQIREFIAIRRRSSEAA